MKALFAQTRLVAAMTMAIAGGTAMAATLTPMHVPTTNAKVAGMAAPNRLSPELYETVVAEGAMALENGSGVFQYYGYNADGPMLPAPGDVQAPGHNVEAAKTEPDKNVYLILRDQTGGDTSYRYGTHFLFQGHEGGVKSAGGARMGYLTRINLDADGTHRVTLMATADRNGKPLPTFDGITWHPFAQLLLLTAEGGSAGGVWQATLDYPSTVDDISGALGRGGYEGIQSDNHGNLWIVEDVGGKSGATARNAKQANSFLYRFVPKDTGNLLNGGRLQALQAINPNTGKPIVFHGAPANPDVDILSQDMKDLHTYGLRFVTHWVTIHDTDVDGFVPFSANALAKANGATPFKRPENGVFRPGSHFTEFYFDETGDTNVNTEAAAYGGFGSVLKLVQADAGADVGTLSLFYKGDVAHTGFDNVAFWSRNEIVFVEDGGDTLHSQRNAYDSGYLFNVEHDYADAQEPVRILALGRDGSATIDSALGATAGNGFQNDGDNEITGFHVSDGDASPHGLLGAKVPTPFADGWRVFYTQQHGENRTFEILPKENNRDRD